MFQRQGSGAPGGAAGEHAAAPAMAPGRQTLTERLPPRPVEAAADRGVSGAAAELPFHAQIQQSFGRHDVSGIRAHTDENAAAGAREMGAEAFAAGDRVAFAGPPTLHVAAHEAAHVIQQRAGVSAATDEHERHADAVADRVVAGASAEDLLDRYAPSGGASAVVQRYPTSNKFNEPCPPAVRDALKAAHALVDQAATAMAKITDNGAYKKYFAEPDAMAIRDKVIAILRQLETFMAKGEVVVGSDPAQVVETSGYRFVGDKDPIHPPTAVANAIGTGDEALISFFPALLSSSADKAKWVVIHEASHAAPEIESEDHAYRWERIFPALAKIGNEKDNNADTWALLVFEVTGTPLPKPGREDPLPDDGFVKPFDADLEAFVREKIALADKGVIVACDRLRRLSLYLDRCQSKQKWLESEYLSDVDWLAMDLPLLKVRAETGPTSEQRAEVTAVAEILNGAREAFANDFAFEQVPVEEEPEPFVFGTSTTTYVTRALLTIEDPVDKILSCILQGWAEDRTEEVTGVVVSFLMNRDWM